VAAPPAVLLGHDSLVAEGSELVIGESQIHAEKVVVGVAEARQAAGVRRRPVDVRGGSGDGKVPRAGQAAPPGDMRVRGDGGQVQAI